MEVQSLPIGAIWLDQVVGVLTKAARSRKPAVLSAEGEWAFRAALVDAGREHHPRACLFSSASTGPGRRRPPIAMALFRHGETPMATPIRTTRIGADGRCPYPARARRMRAKSPRHRLIQNRLSLPCPVLNGAAMLWLGSGWPCRHDFSARPPPGYRVRHSAIEWSQACWPGLAVIDGAISDFPGHRRLGSARAVIEMAPAPIHRGITVGGPGLKPRAKALIPLALAPLPIAVAPMADASAADLAVLEAQRCGTFAKTLSTFFFPVHWAFQNCSLMSCLETVPSASVTTRALPARVALARDQPWGCLPLLLRQRPTGPQSSDCLRQPSCRQGLITNAEVVFGSGVALKVVSPATVRSW